MSRLLLSTIRLLWLRRWCDELRLNLRRRLLGRIAVEISHRAGRFRGWRRPQFVDYRSGQTVLRPAAPPASATTSAPPRPPLAAGRLIGASQAGLLIGFVFVGFALIGNDAGYRDRVEWGARGVIVVAWRSAFARLAGTAAPSPPPLALVAIHFRLTAAVFAGRGILDQAFGLLGFHFGFDFDVDRLFLVERLL